MFKYFITLFILCSLSCADYSTNIIGEGSLSSYSNFGNCGSSFRTSDGEFGIGILQKDNGFFSGAELVNSSSNGNYKFWGVFDNGSQTIDISRANNIYAVSNFGLEEKVTYDTAGQKLSSYLGGQTSINASFTGYGVEKIRGVKTDECGRNRPLELETVRGNGTIQITSEWVV